MTLLNKLTRLLVRLTFRISCRGEEYLRPANQGKMVVGNHQAGIDIAILASLLVEKSWFIVAKASYPTPLVQYLFPWVRFVKAESLAAEGWQSLTRHLIRGGVAAIFPEIIPSQDGSFAKMDPASLQSVREAGVDIVALHMHGSQYHPSSSRKDSLPRRWFPKITISILKPEKPLILLNDMLGKALVAHFNGQGSLWGALCRVGRVYGAAHQVVTDSSGVTLNYRQIYMRSLILGEAIARYSHVGERVGVLLPTSAGGLLTFFALQAIGRIPALLNFTSGSKSILSACRTGRIQTLLTSRLFVKKGGFGDKFKKLSRQVSLVYLEDLRPEIGFSQKLRGALYSLWPEKRLASLQQKPDDEAVILFTSGSEGEPKGVVLSHNNILCNIHQIRARIGLHADDVFLNVLPLFHAFGLTVGTLAPLLAGVRCHYHPSPLEYKKIPELAYRIRATVFAGTNTFLAGYGRSAHPYDFQTLRLVVAGAEVLREDTRHLWMEKFGIRIFEGYGATETSPVMAVNTAIFYRAGTVGRLLPGIEYRLLPVAGVEDGGLLLVRGGNIMLGYLHPGGDGMAKMPATSDPGLDIAANWYDTGDVVLVDELGYIKIIGRVKRFAKVAGEMISLATVETCAATIWPEVLHAVVALPDAKKGEAIYLATEKEGATRDLLLGHIKREGLSKLHLPTQIIQLPTIPLTGTGKIDYNLVKELVSANSQSL